ncbi:unnamed protein product [Rotaria sp. Silwood1]|nr:unnamed protein product [Rotaria sp. Silwood1]
MIESEDSSETVKLSEESAKYREKDSELFKRFDTFHMQLKRQKIESFEDLVKQDKEAKEVLVNLTQATRPAPLEGINIGFFGLTSTGKSTMLNSLLGQNVADTGVGETTTKVTPYSGTEFTLWDVPGRNDEVSFFSMEYISFFKGLSRRLILIQATVKENSSMMKLLDEVGLHYDIVFNKFDKVEPDEQELVKRQINEEIKHIGLKGIEHIYFVSAKNPKMFDDWLTMANSLTSCSTRSAARKISIEDKV